jgi:hypothetical protein
MPVILRNKMRASDFLLAVLEAKSIASLRYLFSDEVIPLLKDDFSSMIEIDWRDLTECIEPITLVFDAGQLSLVEFRDACGYFEITTFDLPMGWRRIPSESYVKIVSEGKP